MKIDNVSLVKMCKIPNITGGEVVFVIDGGIVNVLFFDVSLEEHSILQGSSTL